MAAKKRATSRRATTRRTTKGRKATSRTVTRRKTATRKPRTVARRTTTRRTTRARVPIAVPAPWKADRAGKKISVDLKTFDFREALDLMNEIARVADDLNHHPDFHLERWNNLRITSYSHDVGRLTDRDERLATRISSILEKRGLPR